MKIWKIKLNSWYIGIFWRIWYLATLKTLNKKGDISYNHHHHSHLHRRHHHHQLLLIHFLLLKIKDSNVAAYIYSYLCPVPWCTLTLCWYSHTETLHTAQLVSSTQEERVCLTAVTTISNNIFLWENMWFCSDNFKVIDFIAAHFRLMANINITGCNWSMQDLIFFVLLHITPLCI